jgi:hypothetical protein
VIETTGSSVSRTVMACSSRCWRSQACGESPVLSLKARQKWKRVRPASEAGYLCNTVQGLRDNYL